jgi:hypothetical protein
MRHSDIFLPQSAASSWVMQINPSRIVGSFIIGGAEIVNLPTTYDTAASPTKDLFDRLSDLKAKYAKPTFPESEPPCDRAFLDARNFVLTIPLASMVKPTIHVASDGEVNFQWSGSNFQIDLGFYGNERFSFYASKDGCAPVIGDDVPVTEGIPKTLVDFASAG